MQEQSRIEAVNVEQGMFRAKRTSLRLGAPAALLSAGLVYWLGLRPWHIRWGTTDAEVMRPLPGDEIVPYPRKLSTRAVTIRASAAAIWPWLAQIGQGRGGLYSYDWLENLAGCDIHTADRVVPELQDLRAGDIVRLGPEGYPAYPVAAVEPGCALVLGGTTPATGAHSWVFFLEPLDEQTTRLIVRSRDDYPPTLANFLIWRVITEPLHFLMERKMLLGIKQRAETAVAQPVTYTALLE
jgi:hypothetical protein